MIEVNFYLFFGLLLFYCFTLSFFVASILVLKSFIKQSQRTWDRLNAVERVIVHLFEDFIKIRKKLK
jgi:hypothetical protein